MSVKPLITFFKDIDKEDIPLVGGKGANLGEMTQAGFPVPNGFSVTVESYNIFLQRNDISQKINEVLKGIDVNNSEELESASKKVEKIVTTSEIPAEVAHEIISSYKKLSGHFKTALVAVRSSAKAEDLPGASFAGQQATFLNIKGEASVVEHIRLAWASLFTPRATFYRAEKGFDHFKVGIAVPVQKMIQSEASGVMFTLDPLSNDTTKILIEAIFGLGEAIVSGDVTPDQYLVDKNGISIIDKEIHKQEWQLVKGIKAPLGELEPNIKTSVPPSKQAKQKLSDKDIVALAKVGKMIEDHYQFPQDVEWAKKGKDLFILQTRPVTTLKPKEETKIRPKIEAKAILTGIAASPGIAVGPVKIVEASQIDKVKNGDVLVAEMTTPDFVPAMKRAAGIVTDRGGRNAPPDTV